MIVNILSRSEELPGTLDLCYATYDKATNYITFDDMDGKPYTAKPDDVQAILLPKSTLLDGDSLYILRDIFDTQRELKREGRHVFRFNVEE